MKITTERLERSQVLLNIEVDPDAMARSMERAYRKIASRTAIPGFRKGKAPRALIERYVGRGTVLEEALDILIPEVYNEALKSEEIEPVAQPRIDVVQAEPLIFTATVSVRATVELADYRSLSFEMPVADVTDERVDEELAQLRQHTAPWEPVERPVAFGDQATLDIESTVDGDKPFFNRTGLEYPVTESFQYPVPGFSPELVGMESGGAKEFVLTLPDDYSQTDLAGKLVTFTVSVSAVKAKNLPELDDGFAKSVGQGQETLEELRAWLGEQLREDAERTARREVEEQVVQAVIAQTTLDYPEVLVDHEVEHLMEDVIPASLSNNQARVDEYLEQIGKTREELQEERRPEATRRLVRSLVLSKVADAEGIVVGDDEVMNEIIRLIVSSGQQGERLAQMLSTAEGRESMARMLRTRKTVDKLVEYATGIPAPGPERMISAREAEVTAETEASKADAGEGRDEEQGIRNKE